MDSRSRKSLLAGVMCALLIAGCASNSKKASAPASKTLQDPPQTAANNRAVSGNSGQNAFSSYHPAAAEMLNESAPEQYVVKKGDTLWDISERFLSEPWYWPEIWHANPEIKNPHLIYPGDVISLYYVDGEPRLGINYSGPSGQYKLSPRIRSTPLESSAGIPISSIKPFLLRPQVVTVEEMKSAAHVLDSDEARLVYGSGDRIYVHGLNANIGDEFSIFRKGQALHDPATETLLGYEAIYTGDARVVANHGEITTVVIKNAIREILRGDRLLPLDQGATGMHFWPHSPEPGSQGTIIAISNALSQVAQHQVVAVNLGSSHGIEPGHVFAINQRGRIVPDPYHRAEPQKTFKLPQERTGLLMIYRTFNRVSYGLIMESTRPIRKGDVVVAP